MSRLLAALVLTLCPPAALGHDFWIQPDAYRVGPGGAVSIDLMVGHGLSRQRSPIPLRRITRFEAIGPNGVRTDLRGSLHPGDGASDGELHLRRSGAYVMVLETDDRAQSHQPAERFNRYLNEEGLFLVVAERERRDRLDADGSEAYSRAAKSIVRLGRRTGSEEHVMAPAGLRLEIVPERIPEAAVRFPVLVLYQGLPLGGALVKLTDLANDEAPVEVRQTDRDGRAGFTVPRAGSWLLNVVWSTPLPDSREVEFETVFSSLTFATP